jgi:hypothetical protein
VALLHFGYHFFQVTEDIGGEPLARATRDGSVYVPPAVESLSYDADGNLLGDGRWLYTWDANNHLTGMEASLSARQAGVPWVKLAFTYDSLSRRITKKVWKAEENAAESTLALREEWR